MVRDPLATHNERMKLIAGFINAIGLGLIGFAVLRPISENLANARLSTLWWMLAGLAMHVLSLYILKYLRKEAP